MSVEPGLVCFNSGGVMADWEILTSFNIFTLAVIPSTSVSFWDSSDESTASE